MNRYGIKLENTQGYRLIVKATSEEGALNTFFYYMNMDEDHVMRSAYTAEELSEYAIAKIFEMQQVSIVEEVAK
ncbi:hypothetical protein P4261_28210 [Bacillus thuringiensis]|nr:hypothetical protein [Bacillus thuringiensis]MED2829767.1 hypothetical protein [Bacillus thuringiensis]MED2856373.1 hypothetical protein [Bacillus thuringiensis]MED2863823.1 hypothetical protein [Bacillus thuringiensis]